MSNVEIIIREEEPTVKLDMSLLPPPVDIFDKIETLIIDTTKQEETKKKRRHKRNSSLSFENKNNMIWLNNCLKQFKIFLRSILLKVDDRSNLYKWIYKIESVPLNMLYLSFDATPEFKEVIKTIRRYGKQDSKIKALMTNAVNEVMINNDIDQYDLTPYDIDKINRYMLIFIISYIEN